MDTGFFLFFPNSIFPTLEIFFFLWTQFQRNASIQLHASLQTGSHRLTLAAQLNAAGIVGHWPLSLRRILR